MIVFLPLLIRFDYSFVCIPDIFSLHFPFVLFTFNGHVGGRMKLDIN